MCLCVQMEEIDVFFFGVQWRRPVTSSYIIVIALWFIYGVHSKIYLWGLC